MFYTYGEKQGNVFFDGWQMRQIAFDSMRRYLYYSAATLTDRQIAYPNDNDNPLSEQDSVSLPGTPTTSPLRRTSTPESVVAARERAFVATPPQPNMPSDITWRKKIKVDLIVLVAKEHEFMLEDSHLKEMDLYQVEIHGESRVLQAGESPAPGPMLVPSAGWAGLPDRFTPDNEEYVKDPFFFRELYEALRDQFTTLRMEREEQERVTGKTSDPRFAKVQSIQSPRGKHESVAKGSRVKVIFRLRTEYEYRRFWYVVQTVLGYDKLGVRPYRGLPPYDPRNGLIFAQVPMCVWHTFKALDKAVIYMFLRGDLAGRSLKGELTIFLHGAYLCLTHDMVMVMRDTGNIPRWVRIQEVREFEYNSKCHKPYFSFITDAGAPDIVFIPQPPIYGPDAIRRFSPQLETLRMVYIVKEMCFGSLDVRRVIHVREVPERSVRSFIERKESDLGRQLNFDPAVGYSAQMSCPLPKEQLATVWREVQNIYAARDPVAVSQAAIPLYANNTNDTILTSTQLQTLERRLNRERVTRDDVVGMPYDEARQMPTVAVGGHDRRHRSASPTGERGTPGDEADEAGHGDHHRSHSVTNGANARASRRALPSPSSSAATPSSPAPSPQANDTPAAVQLPADRLETPQLESLPHGLENPLGIGEVAGQETAVTNCSFGASVTYGVPGARYITQEELEGGMCGCSPSGVATDEHTVIMGQTPMAGGHTAPYLQGGSILNTHSEMNVDELMSRSIAHMRTTVPDSSPLEIRRGKDDKTCSTACTSLGGSQSSDKASSAAGGKRNSHSSPASPHARGGVPAVTAPTGSAPPESTTSIET